MPETNKRMDDTLNALGLALDDPFKLMKYALVPASTNDLKGEVEHYIPALQLLVIKKKYRLFTAYHELVTFFAKKKEGDVVAFLGNNVKNISGLTEHSTKSIYVDHDMHPAAITYTYSHELAHAMDTRDREQTNTTVHTGDFRNKEELKKLETVAYGVALLVGEELGLENGFGVAASGMAMYGIKSTMLNEHKEQILAIVDEQLKWLHSPAMTCLNKFTRLFTSLKRKRD